MSTSSLTSPETISAVTFLKQEIQQLNYTLEIKQKKITYLQAQLKSFRGEYSKKIQILENSYNELKKEKHLFARQMMQEKTFDHVDFQEKIKKLHHENQLKLSQKEQFYQSLLRQKQQKFETTIKNMEYLYEQIIKKVKEQNYTLQNLLITKNIHKSIDNQSESFTFNSDEFKYLSLGQENMRQISSSNRILANDSNAMRQKISMMQQIMTYKQKYQKIKNQLQMEKQINIDMQNQKRNILSEEKQEIQLLKKSIENLNNKIGLLNEEKQTQKDIYMQKICQLEQKVQKYKQNLKKADTSYLDAVTSRVNTERNVPVTTVKSCNHQGLIYQMEKNLSLKNQQILQLREKIDHWENIIGLGKSFDQRLQQVGNICNRTEQIYKNQKGKIKQQVDKIMKK